LGKPQVSHAPAESNRGPRPPESDSSDQIVPIDDRQRDASINSVLISETFSSRQGEGKLTGTESFFIRTSGCNLRCWFCDTPYASWDARGEKQSIDCLLDQARESGKRHVVLTGGEPLLPSAAQNLSTSLIEAGFHLTIETAGTIHKPIACDLLSLSPKLESSAPDPSEHQRWHRLHQERRLPLATMRTLIEAAKDFQLKFVVTDRSQFDEIRTIAEALDVANQDVFIMPQGVTIEDMDAADKWLRPWCESVGYQYCDRMQIRWFGNRRGT
jgi:7-carboxy-7-deazaguanine synthase